ncbi:MAG: DNA/RNA non-specific endonuclease [Gemmatimonadaceae bacterium]
MLSSLSRFMRPVALALVLVSCAAERAVAPTPAAPPTASAVGGPTSPTGGVVVSQLYGGGGNSGSTYKNDYIELYNAGTTDVSLTDWSVQYASSAGTTWQVTLLTGTIASGHYYLVQESAGTGGTTSLPTPDATGSIAMSATSGKVALVNGKTALAGSGCPITAPIVDFVGFGSSASCHEGSGNTPTLTNTTAALRANNGGQDTNDNAADFTVGAPNPRNSAGDGGGNPPPQQGGPVATVTVSPSTQSIFVDAPQKFTAAAKDSAGVVVSSTYTWSSSDTTVATIDQTGNATAVKIGTTTITATSANNKQGTATLTVRSSSSNAVYRNSLEFGTPTDADASDDYIITRPQYTISYNKNRDDPNWVAWNLNATQLGSTARSNAFSPDPALPPDIYHVVTSDYTGSGYDRGHMSPSGDRTASAADNLVTFYMTNMLPQYHNLNAGPWEDLETYSRSLVTGQNKELYIISGGIFPASPQTLNNAGKIQIPTSTWKIVVVVGAGQGLADVHSTKDLQVLAVNMPDSLTVPIGAPWQNYTTTVNAIEKATGYNFLSALPDSIQKIVEANDHPPVATLSAQGATTVTLGQAVNVTGKFTDVDGKGDAPWSYVFNWGDGTITKGIQLSYPSDLTAFTRTKTYAAPGTYVVRFTVTDKYGAAGYTEVPVTVQP